MRRGSRVRISTGPKLKMTKQKLHSLELMLERITEDQAKVTAIQTYESVLMRASHLIKNGICRVGQLFRLSIYQDQNKSLI